MHPHQLLDVWKRIQKVTNLQSAAEVEISRSIVTSLAPLTYAVLRRFTVQQLADILSICQQLDCFHERLVGGVLLELTYPSKKSLFFFDDVLSLLETCAKFELQEIEFLNHLAERIMESIPPNQLPKDLPTLCRFFEACSALYYRYPELFDILMTGWEAQGRNVAVHELESTKQLLDAFLQLQYSHKGFVDATKARLATVGDVVERRLLRDLNRTLSALESVPQG